MKYQIICMKADVDPAGEVDELDVHFSLFLKTFRHLLHRRHYKDVRVSMIKNPYTIYLDLIHLSEITRVNFLVELDANLRRRRCIWGASIRYEADRFDPGYLVMILVDRIKKPAQEES